MQKKIAVPLSLLFALLIIVGCSRSWQYQPIEAYQMEESFPSAATCQNCHADAYASWEKNKHSSETNMSIIPVEGLRECGACHGDATAHAENPSSNVPSNPAKLSKTEQNTLCGKCHFNQELFGRKAINPHDRHALFMSVGLEGRKRQLSCLDCHSGHHGKSEMLVSAKAHICFKCHKVAIVAMGVFQPLNYLTMGKTCQACHSVHGGSAKAQAARMGTGVCIVCHFVGTGL